MDLNVLLDDLRNAAENLRKNPNNCKPLSNVYCHKVNKAVEKVSNWNSEYGNIITGLWVITAHFTETVDSLLQVPSFKEAATRLFRECAKAVLNIQWQNLEEESDVRQRFVVSLANLNAKFVPLNYQRFRLLEALLENPWTDPTLAKIMGGEAEDEEEIEEVRNYIAGEDAIILQLRVDMMLKENCEEYALNLCNSCLLHPELRRDLTLRKTQLSLLHKLGLHDKLQEECQNLSVQEAVNVIRQLQTRNTKEICTVLAQTFMVQHWIRQKDHKANKDLLRLWIRQQALADKDQDRFKESVWAIAKLSQSTEQILFFIDILREQCGKTYLQLYVDMCIFAINVDKGQMETSVKQGQMDMIKARKEDMSAICGKLACLNHHASIKVARICVLTAFVLKPCTETFQSIIKFYSQNYNCCGTCSKTLNTDHGAVNPATLYEVERLLNMLRPDYLNPDNSLSNIKILCERFCKENNLNFSLTSTVPKPPDNNTQLRVVQIEAFGKPKATSAKPSNVFEAVAPSNMNNTQALQHSQGIQSSQYGSSSSPNFQVQVSSVLHNRPNILHSGLRQTYPTTNVQMKGIANTLDLNKSRQPLLKSNLPHQKSNSQSNRCSNSMTLGRDNHIPAQSKNPTKLNPQLIQYIQSAIRQNSSVVQELIKHPDKEIVRTVINMLNQAGKSNVSATVTKSFIQQQQNQGTLIGDQSSLSMASTLFKAPTIDGSHGQKNILQPSSSRIHSSVSQSPSLTTADCVHQSAKAHSSQIGCQSTLTPSTTNCANSCMQKVESFMKAKIQAGNIRSVMQSSLLQKQQVLSKQMAGSTITVNQSVSGFPVIGPVSNTSASTKSHQQHRSLNIAQSHQSKNIASHSLLNSHNTSQPHLSNIQQQQLSSSQSNLLQPQQTLSSDELSGSIVGIDDKIITELLQDAGIFSNTFPDIEVDFTFDNLDKKRDGRTVISSSDLHLSCQLIQSENKLCPSIPQQSSSSNSLAQNQVSAFETKNSSTSLNTSKRCKTSPIPTALKSNFNQYIDVYGKRQPSQSEIKPTVDSSLLPAKLKITQMQPQVSVEQIRERMKQEQIEGEVTMDSSNNATYRCIICSLAFKVLEDLREHVRNICKPGLQSSSVYNTKIKQDRVNSAKAGLETTTVFQCLRCFELCISQDGIKQHRLTCKRVPTVPSDIKNATLNSKTSKTPPLNRSATPKMSSTQSHIKTTIMETKPKVTDTNLTKIPEKLSSPFLFSNVKDATPSDQRTSDGNKKIETTVTNNANTKVIEMKPPSVPVVACKIETIITNVSNTSKEKEVMKPEEVKKISQKSEKVSPPLTSSNYSEISGSGGCKFYRCKNCSQTLCSYESLVSHWKDCGTKPPVCPHINQKFPLDADDELEPGEIRPLVGNVLHNVTDVIGAVARGEIGKMPLVDSDVEDLDFLLTQDNLCGSSEIHKISSNKISKKEHPQSFCSYDGSRSNSAQCANRKISCLPMKKDPVGKGVLKEKNDEINTPRATSAFASSRLLPLKNLIDDEFIDSNEDSNPSDDSIKVCREAPPSLRDRNKLKPIQSFKDESFVSSYAKSIIHESSTVSTSKNKRIKTSKGVDRHNTELHKADFKCIVCGKVCNSNRILIQHYAGKHLQPYSMNTLTDGSSYICHLCKRSFSTFMHYMHHVPNHGSIIMKKMNIQYSSQIEKKTHWRNRIAASRGFTIANGKKRGGISPKRAKALRSKKKATKTARERMKKVVSKMNIKSPFFSLNGNARSNIVNKRRIGYRGRPTNAQQSLKEKLLKRKIECKKLALTVDIPMSETEDSCASSSPYISDVSDDEYYASEDVDSDSTVNEPPQTRNRSRVTRSSHTKNSSGVGVKISPISLSLHPELVKMSNIHPCVSVHRLTQSEVAKFTKSKEKESELKLEVDKLESNRSMLKDDSQNQKESIKTCVQSEDNLLLIQENKNQIHPMVNFQSSFESYIKQMNSNKVQKISKFDGEPDSKIDRDVKNTIAQSTTDAVGEKDGQSSNSLMKDTQIISSVRKRRCSVYLGQKVDIDHIKTSESKLQDISDINSIVSAGCKSSLSLISKINKHSESSNNDSDFNSSLPKCTVILERNELMEKTSLSGKQVKIVSDNGCAEATIGLDINVPSDAPKIFSQKNDISLKSPTLSPFEDQFEQFLQKENNEAENFSLRCDDNDPECGKQFEDNFQKEDEVYFSSPPTFECSKQELPTEAMISANNKTLHNGNINVTPDSKLNELKLFVDSIDIPVPNSMMINEGKSCSDDIIKMNRRDEKCRNDSEIKEMDVESSKIIIEDDNRMSTDTNSNGDRESSEKNSIQNRLQSEIVKINKDGILGSEDTGMKKVGASIQNRLQSEIVKINKDGTLGSEDTGMKKVGAFPLDDEFEKQNILCSEEIKEQDAKANIQVPSFEGESEICGDKFSKDHQMRKMQQSYINTKESKCFNKNMDNIEVHGTTFSLDRRILYQDKVGNIESKVSVNVDENLEERSDLGCVVFMSNASVYDDCTQLNENSNKRNILDNEKVLEFVKHTKEIKVDTCAEVMEKESKEVRSEEFIMNSNEDPKITRQETMLSEKAFLNKLMDGGNDNRDEDVLADRPKTEVNSSFDSGKRLEAAHDKPSSSHLLQQGRSYKFQEEGHGLRTQSVEENSLETLPLDLNALQACTIACNTEVGHYENKKEKSSEKDVGFCSATEETQLIERQKIAETPAYIESYNRLKETLIKEENNGCHNECEGREQCKMADVCNDSDISLGVSKGKEVWDKEILVSSTNKDEKQFHEQPGNSNEELKIFSNKNDEVINCELSQEHLVSNLKSVQNPQEENVTIIMSQRSTPSNLSDSSIFIESVSEHFKDCVFKVKDINNFDGSCKNVSLDNDSEIDLMKKEKDVRESPSIENVLLSNNVETKDKETMYKNTSVNFKHASSSRNFEMRSEEAISQDSGIKEKMSLADTDLVNFRDSVQDNKKQSEVASEKMQDSIFVENLNCEIGLTMKTYSVELERESGKETFWKKLEMNYKDSEETASDVGLIHADVDENVHLDEENQMNIEVLKAPEYKDVKQKEEQKTMFWSESVFKGDRKIVELVENIEDTTYSNNDEVKMDDFSSDFDKLEESNEHELYSRSIDEIPGRASCLLNTCEDNICTIQSRKDNNLSVDEIDKSHLEKLEEINRSKRLEEKEIYEEIRENNTEKTLFVASHLLHVSKKKSVSDVVEQSDSSKQRFEEHNEHYESDIDILDYSQYGNAERKVTLHRDNNQLFEGNENMTTVIDSICNDSNIENEIKENAHKGLQENAEDLFDSSSEVIILKEKAASEKGNRGSNSFEKYDESNTDKEWDENYAANLRIDNGDQSYQNNREDVKKDKEVTSDVYKKDSGCEIDMQKSVELHQDIGDASKMVAENKFSKDARETHNHLMTLSPGSKKDISTLQTTKEDGEKDKCYDGEEDEEGNFKDKEFNDMETDSTGRDHKRTGDIVVGDVLVQSGNNKKDSPKQLRTRRRVYYGYNSVVKLPDDSYMCLESDIKVPKTNIENTDKEVRNGFEEKKGKERQMYNKSHKRGRRSGKESVKDSNQISYEKRSMNCQEPLVKTELENVGKTLRKYHDESKEDHDDKTQESLVDENKDSMQMEYSGKDLQGDYDVRDKNLKKGNEVIDIQDSCDLSFKYQQNCEDSDHQTKCFVNERKAKLLPEEVCANETIGRQIKKKTDILWQNESDNYDDDRTTAEELKARKDIFDMVMRKRESLSIKKLLRKLKMKASIEVEHELVGTESSECETNFVKEENMIKKTSFQSGEDLCNESLDFEADESSFKSNPDLCEFMSENVSRKSSNTLDIGDGSLYNLDSTKETFVLDGSIEHGIMGKNKYSENMSTSWVDKENVFDKPRTEIGLLRKIPGFDKQDVVIEKMKEESVPLKCDLKDNPRASSLGILDRSTYSNDATLEWEDVKNLNENSTCGPHGLIRNQTSDKEIACKDKANPADQNNYENVIKKNTGCKLDEQTSFELHQDIGDTNIVVDENKASKDAIKTHEDNVDLVTVGSGSKEDLCVVETTIKACQRDKDYAGEDETNGLNNFNKSRIWNLDIQEKESLGRDHKRIDLFSQIEGKKSCGQKRNLKQLRTRRRVYYGYNSVLKLSEDNANVLSNENDIQTPKKGTKGKDIEDRNVEQDEKDKEVIKKNQKRSVKNKESLDKTELVDLGETVRSCHDETNENMIVAVQESQIDKNIDAIQTEYPEMVGDDKYVFDRNCEGENDTVYTDRQVSYDLVCNFKQDGCDHEKSKDNEKDSVIEKTDIKRIEVISQNSNNKGTSKEIDCQTKINSEYLDIELNASIRDTKKSDSHDISEDGVTDMELKARKDILDMVMKKRKSLSLNKSKRRKKMMFTGEDEEYEIDCEKQDKSDEMGETENNNCEELVREKNLNDRLTAMTKRSGSSCDEEDLSDYSLVIEEDKSSFKKYLDPFGFMNKNKMRKYPSTKDVSKAVTTQSFDNMEETFDNKRFAEYESVNTEEKNESISVLRFARETVTENSKTEKVLSRKVTWLERKREAFMEKKRVKSEPFTWDLDENFKTSACQKQDRPSFEAENRQDRHDCDIKVNNFHEVDDGSKCSSLLKEDSVKKRKKSNLSTFQDSVSVSNVNKRTSRKRLSSPTSQTLVKVRKKLKSDSKLLTDSNISMSTTESPLPSPQKKRGRPKKLSNDTSVVENAHVCVKESPHFINIDDDEISFNTRSLSPSFTSENTPEKGISIKKRGRPRKKPKTDSETSPHQNLKVNKSASPESNPSPSNVSDPKLRKAGLIPVSKTPTPPTPTLSDVRKNVKSPSPPNNSIATLCNQSCKKNDEQNPLYLNLSQKETFYKQSKVFEISGNKSDSPASSSKITSPLFDKSGDNLTLEVKTQINDQNEKDTKTESYNVTSTAAVVKRRNPTTLRKHFDLQKAIKRKQTCPVKTQTIVYRVNPLPKITNTLSVPVQIEKDRTVHKTLTSGVSHVNSQETIDGELKWKISKEMKPTKGKSKQHHTSLSFKRT